jgi:hypothetical protein
MRSIVSRPRAASRRSPLAVIEPSGNASAAATLKRLLLPPHKMNPARFKQLMREG